MYRVMEPWKVCRQQLDGTSGLLGRMDGTDPGNSRMPGTVPLLLQARRDGRLKQARFRRLLLDSRLPPAASPSASPPPSPPPPVPRALLLARISLLRQCSDCCVQQHCRCRSTGQTTVSGAQQVFQRRIRRLDPGRRCCRPVYKLGKASAAKYEIQTSDDQVTYTTQLTYAPWELGQSQVFSDPLAAKVSRHVRIFMIEAVSGYLQHLARLRQWPLSPPAPPAQPEPAATKLACPPVDFFSPVARQCV